MLFAVLNLRSDSRVDPKFLYLFIRFERPLEELLSFRFRDESRWSGASGAGFLYVRLDLFKPAQRSLT
jgi:hypothetical protein